MSKKYDLPKGITFGSTNLLHYPTEDHYCCDTCKMLLSFPWKKGQRGDYNPSPYAVEDPTVIANKETVLVLDETNRDGVKPTVIK